MQVINKLLLLAAITSVGCSRTIPPTFTNAPVQVICELSDNIAMIGEPESLSVFDEGFAIISNPGKVLLFDFNGNQTRDLGRPGNAKYEYNLPYIIRSHKDSIYLWSANSLKFIVFSKNGLPHSEYKYPSAIRDFVPTDSLMFIYASGTRVNNIIDVYSKEEQSIIDSVWSSTEEHLTLLSKTSVAPIVKIEDNILFAPKDQMNIMKYNFVSRITTMESNISSDTFIVDNVKDSEVLLSNRNRMLDYLMTNSFTVSIIPDKSNLKILTLEGKDEDDSANRRISYDKRYYTLYDLNRGVPLAHYSYASLAPQYLFSVHNDSLFFIKKIPNPEKGESYILCKLLN